MARVCYEHTLRNKSYIKLVPSKSGREKFPKMVNSLLKTCSPGYCKKSLQDPKVHLDSRNAPSSQITRSVGTREGLASLQSLHDALLEDVHRPTETSHIDHLKSSPKHSDASEAFCSAPAEDGALNTSFERDLDESSRMFSDDHGEPYGEIFQQIDTHRLRQILQQVHEMQGQQQQQQEEQVRPEIEESKIQQVPSVEQLPTQYHHQHSGHTPSDNTPLHHPMVVPHNFADPSFKMPWQNVVPETIPQNPYPPTYPTPPPVMWMPVFVPPQPTRRYPCPDCGCCAPGPAPQCRQNVSTQSVEKTNTNGLFGHTHVQSSKRDLFESALNLAKSFVGNRTSSCGSSSSSSSQSSPAKIDSSPPSAQSTTSTKIGNTFLLDFQQTTMLAFAYEIDDQMDKDVFNCEHLAHLLLVPPSVIRKWFENRRATSFLMQTKDK